MKERYEKFTNNRKTRVTVYVATLWLEDGNIFILAVLHLLVGAIDYISSMDGRSKVISYQHDKV